MKVIDAAALTAALGHGEFSVRSFERDGGAVSVFQTFEDRDDPPFDLIEGDATVDPETGEAVPSQVKKYRDTWRSYDDLTDDQKVAYDEAEAKNAAPIVRGTPYTHNGQDLVVPDLTPRQWSLLLDASGARVVLDAVLASMPKETEVERIAWAQLRATSLNSGVYTWATTARLVSGLRAQGVQGIPTDDELIKFWMMAAEDKGL